MLNFGNLISGVPTVDIGLVDFISLAEKKLVLDNLPHFIRMELWDAPSGIAIVSNNIEVVYLEERALTSIQSMRNTVMPSLGDVNHSPNKLAVCCRGRLRMCGGFPPTVMATKSPTRMKSSILLEKMPNGVDEGLTLGLPTVIIVACFCCVVWVFRKLFADVTHTI
jgi:hypothetical protein